MTIADAPPDWSTHAADVTCPLCDYNLRGLADPRCPECGFAFTWAELLDAKRDHHPWLFEHAVPGPRRRRAFWKTHWRTCAPRWFWRAVTPANPVRRKPLIRYWIITTLLLSGVIIGPLLVEAVQTAIGFQQARAAFSSALGSTSTIYTPYSIRGLHYTAAELNATFPPIWSPRFGVAVADAYLRRTGGAFVAVVVVTAAWPWLTAAALLVFQASMRRAKTNGDHVLRAAIYSCDFGVLITGLAVGVFWLMDDRGTAIRRQQVVELSAILAVLTAGVCVVVTTYRLTIAYGRYLRFHLPLATVLASQVIAFLVLLAVAVKVAEVW